MLKKFFYIILIFSMKTAWADTEDNNYFIGIKSGYQWAQDKIYEHKDPKGSIYGVYTGVHFSPSWGLDFGYTKNDVLKAKSTSTNVKVWMIESALRYDCYIQNNLSIYGRLGMAYWNVNKSSTFLENIHASGFSPLSEVGISYQFTTHINLSFGYQFTHSIGEKNTGEYDSQALMLAISYSFTHKRSI
ncbi:outer membrane beta-barrel protein [Photobacterium leiognathi]|uniref:outer membrane beta-barrel protein n=1 Tax=Photobacterium leiognathi TaxID=553611 RepID=UPI002732F0BB|nr:outer membrane beta-barrel protein [Photobacterium leiognathi]